MNRNIIDGLVELEVFDSKFLSEDDYANAPKDDSNTDIIYVPCSYGGKQIDTKGLSNEEIKLLLEIDRTKNIRSIKKMVTFFVVLTLFSIVIAIWSGASIASML